jgi:hypothetical protein
MLALVCAVGLGACATASPEQKQAFAAFQAQAQPAVPAGAHPFIKDERPQHARENYSGSFIISDCNYGVYNFGDKGGGVDRVARLEQPLVDAFGPDAAAQPATLRQYGIYVNRAQLLIGASTASTGLLGYAIGESLKGEGSGQRPKCKREKMAIGWFDQADLTNNFSPIVADIDITFRGKDYKINAAYSPPMEIPSASAKSELPEWVAGIQAVMAKANARLIEAIKADEAH